MPYKIAEKDGAFCVVKESGENVKCHPTKEKATAHLRALYANVHDSRDSMFPEFSMAITKANITNGVMRWRSVNSDIEEDYYGERMSKELFKDFISHIQNNEEIPMPFKSAICEEDWCGGMPYVSIAHYKSGAGMKNVPGEPEKIYLDGNALKSTGVMYDTPLGKAVFKSLQKDLVEKRDDKIRVSIGFLDLEHSHGDKFTFTRRALTDKCPLCAKGVGDKIYKKGHLVHLALTRVPANPRTDLEAIEVEKSMTTKREDAESIIEDKAVIEELDLKSMADDVLVVKSEDEDADDKADGKKKKKDGKEDMYEKSVAEPVAENSVVTPPDPTVLASTTDPRGYKEISPAPEQTAVEASLTAFLGRIIAIKSQGLMGEDALKAIQPDFDNIGEVIKAEFTPAPSPAEVEKANLETTLRSILGAVLDEKFQQFSTQTVAPIQAELETLKGELRAKSLTQVPVKKEEIATVQRSLNPVLVQKAKETVQKSSFDLIAQRSVGLQ